MNYKEALKQLQVKKATENYLMISLSYLRLILPHKEGIKLLDTLAFAEQTGNNYGMPDQIVPLQSDEIKVTVISGKTYQNLKIAGLLNVSLSDVEAAEKELLNSEKEPA